MKTRIIRIIIFFSTLLIPFTINAAEVDKNGFLSHSVQIKLPPGTNGLAPGLSLDYNSGSGNGIAGLGWSLSGLPSISRDRTDGIRYDATDTYTGSAGRLKAQADGTYHYEYENYSRVQMIGQADNPEYWIETKTDGTKCYYGKYDNSSVKANVLAFDSTGTPMLNKVRVWALSKVEDRYGNYYTIEYKSNETADDGEYYPVRIVYTQGNGISRYRIIDLNYEDRNDYNADYSYSARVVTKRRLSEIVVNVNVPTIFGYPLPIFGSTARRYEIHYSAASSSIDCSRVLKVLEYGQDGGLCAVQSFESEVNTDGFTDSGLAGLDSLVWLDYSDRTNRFRVGDFNGDGKSDLIHTSETAGDKLIYLSTDSGFVNAGNWGLDQAAWLDRYAADPDILYSANNSQRFAMGDFDGDGKTDLLHTSDSQNDTIIYQSTGSEFVNTGNWGIGVSQYIFRGLDSSLLLSRYVTGDFNGDGKTDLLHTSDDVGSKAVFISTGTEFVNAGNWGISASAWLDKLDGSQRFVTGDFNGDGKTDLLHTSNTKEDKAVYLSTGTGFVNAGLWGLAADVWLDHSNKTQRFVTGDFNGDGKTDLLHTSNSATDKVVYLSTGSGFVNAGDWGLNSAGLTSNWLDYSSKSERFVVADFNGDGKSDLLHTSNTSGEKVLILSTGTGFTRKDVAEFSSVTWFDHNNNTQRFAVGDFNGDGKSDIIHTSDTYGDKRVFLSKISSQGLITKITTDIGAVIDITYKEAASLPGAIGTGTDNGGIINNATPRKLVTSIKTSDGRGALYTMEYSYKNGKILNGFPSDKKNLYFESVTEYDTGSDIKTVTYYEQDDPWLAGAPVLVESRTAGGHPVKREEYIYNDNTLTAYAGTHSVKLKKLLSAAYVSGSTAYTQSRTFTYDKYGNVTNIFDHSEGTDDIATTITYLQDETNWIVNRPSEVITAADGNIIDGKRYAYSGAKLAAMSIYLDSEGAWLDTAYTSDGCGNILTVTDPMGHKTSMTYDSSYNAFVTEIKNAMGHTVSMEYDADTASANPVSRTDANGNTTDYEYDNSGRVKSVSNEDGELAVIDYHDELHGDPGQQYVQTTVPGIYGQPDSISMAYFDGLGRVYKKKTTAGQISGVNLYQIENTAFDAAGRVKEKTLPYIDGKQTPLVIKYSYNADGMVVAEERPVDQNSYAVTTADYWAGSGYLMVTKRDPNGNISSEKYDSRGRLVKKNEQAGGQVIYTYDGAGRLVRTADSGNNFTAITYDSLGRKTSISDPNTGDTTYSYDNAGNMLSKTDGAGNTILYTYDSINRLVKTDYPDTTPDVICAYDESSSVNGKGRVTSVEEGVSKSSYKYDMNGNIVNMIQTVENIDFEFSMDYDKQGRMISLTYPDSTEIVREYSETGYLKAVKQGAGAYVQYALKYRENGDAGNTVTRITGNGVNTEIGFNPATMRAESIESRDRSNTLLEKNVYKYDLNGNITKIDNLFDTAKTQSFEYDTLNRLKKASGVYGVQNFAYSASGNMTRNSRGYMVYEDRDHPYAVTGDGEGNSYSYDANGSMVSGRGREMSYDAEGRLISLKKDGAEIQKNTYDASGHRIIQQKADGTIIYNIGGLYELVKVPNRADQYTKYIYGIEGDLVSQVTASGAPASGAGFIHSFIFDTGYRGIPVISAAAKACIKTDRFFRSAKNSLKVQYALVLVLFILLTGALIKSGITEWLKPVSGYTRPVWSSATSLILVAAMTGSFSMTGCAPSPEIPGITDGGISVTTDNGGIPTPGTFYFHPDHLGSVSFITDHTGAVVTRMSYAPYGEKTVTGPDIFHQKYTGQVDDGDEAGLLYYNARYYDPELGRFISADSTIPDPAQTQSFNRYMYVMGNPVSFNDPTGCYDSMPGGYGDHGDGWGGIVNGGKTNGSGNGGGGDSGQTHSPTTVSTTGSSGNTDIGSSENGYGATAGSNNGHGGNGGRNYSQNLVSINDERSVLYNNAAGGGMFNTVITDRSFGRNDYAGENREFEFMLTPILKENITSGWGWRQDKDGKLNFHFGMDWGTEVGTSIKAASDGIVDTIDYSETYGNRLILRHINNIKTEYSHTLKIIVAINQKVNKGDIIAFTGRSGKPGTTSHLHFAIKLNGKYQNPGSYLNLKR